MYCGHCGKKLEKPDDLYCSYCGNPVHAAAEKQGSGQADAQTLPEAVPARKKHIWKKWIGIAGGVAVIAVFAVILATLIPKLKPQNEPVVLVEDGALVYYDGLSDEEGITIDPDFGAVADLGSLAASSAAYLSGEAQFSEDGDYLYYLTDGDLMQVDLKQLNKAGRKEAVTQIVSGITDFSVYHGIVVYTTLYRLNYDGYYAGAYIPYEERDDEFLGYYDVAEDQTYVLTKDPDKYCIQPGGCAVSEDGNYILFGEESTLYLYDTKTHSDCMIAEYAEVFSCTKDLTEIVYREGGSVYRTTLDNGEIENAECVFELEQNSFNHVSYADSTAVLYYEGDGYSETACVYKDGLKSSFGGPGTQTFFLPLSWTSVTSDTKYPLSELGNSELWGVCLSEDKTTLIDSNFHTFEASVVADQVMSFAWDDDHNILYVCFEVYHNGNNGSYSNELYAYTMEDGTIIDETRIATNCYEQICYAPASQSLFYYDNYDSINCCGRLCAVVYGEFRYELVENAYADCGSLDGLQFNSTNSQILCWADVCDRVGTLYALDMDAPAPVTKLGTHVSMDTWGMYEGKILFIDNYSQNHGGTLYSYDGSSVEREREDIMAVISDANRYTYPEFGMFY